MEFVMDIAGNVVLYMFIFATVRSVVCRLIQKEVKNTDADRERCIRKTGECWDKWNVLSVLMKG